MASVRHEALKSLITVTLPCNGVLKMNSLRKAGKTLTKVLESGENKNQKKKARDQQLSSMETKEEYTSGRASSVDGYLWENTAASRRGTGLSFGEQNEEGNGSDERVPGEKEGNDDSSNLSRCGQLTGMKL